MRIFESFNDDLGLDDELDVTVLIPEDISITRDGECDICGDEECCETNSCCGCGDACGEDDCYYKVLKGAYKTLFNLQTIHWNAIGTDFYCLHEELDDHIAYTRDIIDIIAEMRLENCEDICNPINLIKSICDDCTVNTADGFEKDEGFALVKDVEDEFIAVLEECYDSMCADIQSVFDDWIRWYKVNSRYKIKRQQSMK